MYGLTEFNPVSIYVWWKSTSAMRRMHAACGQKELLGSIWQQAWPTHVWDEFLQNGLSPTACCPVIHVKVLIESQDELVVPWSWLYGPFTRAPYDMLDCALDHRANTHIAVSLHRPAKDGKYQEVMLTHFVRNDADQFEWEFCTMSRQSH